MIRKHYLRNMNPWILAARLRTLPLALSGIILGAGISHLCSVETPMSSTTQAQPWAIFMTAIVTATLLQVLSNYANDLGDFTKGTDVQANRTDRALASGQIAVGKMKVALAILIVLTLMTGSFLIYISGLFQSNNGIYMLLLGVISIFAALGYTLGTNAYGYWGLGDLSVMFFFGLVPVLGMGMLNGFFVDAATSKYLDVFIISGSGLGFLSVAVLNVNNYRDIPTDRLVNKKTLAVRLGEGKTIIYHRFLLLIGGALIPISLIVFEKRYFERTTLLGSQTLFLLGVFAPIFMQLSSHYQQMKSLTPGDRNALNPQLKKLSLTILFMVLLYVALSCLLIDFLS